MSETYCHLSKWTRQQITPGQVLSTSSPASPYWIGKRDRSWADKVKMPGILGAISLDNFPNIVVQGIPMKEILTTTSLVWSQTSKYAPELLKEYVFEDVRIHEFPERPSRRSCLYAIPEKKNPSEYAAALGFNDGQYCSALKIKPLADAIVHVAPLKYLDCDGLDIAGMEDQARRYWNGPKSEEELVEVLIDGSVEIIEIKEF